MTTPTTTQFDLTPFKHVSPRTGVEYDVVPELQWRMAGGFMEGCPMYRKEYVQYNIELDGKRVQFCFDTADVDTQVHHYEQPGWDGVVGSRYD